LKLADLDRLFVEFTRIIWDRSRFSKTPVDKQLANTKPFVYRIESDTRLHRALLNIPLVYADFKRDLEKRADSDVAFSNVTNTYVIKWNSSCNKALLNEPNWLKRVQRLVDKYNTKKIVNYEFNLKPVFGKKEEQAADAANNETTVGDFENSMSNQFEKYTNESRAFGYELVCVKNKLTLRLYGYRKQTRALKADFVAPELKRAQKLNNLSIVFTKEAHFQVYVTLTEFEGKFSWPSFSILFK
jgi:hypothetical protein